MQISRTLLENLKPFDFLIDRILKVTFLKQEAYNKLGNSTRKYLINNLIDMIFNHK